MPPPNSCEVPVRRALTAVAGAVVLLAALPAATAQVEFPPETGAIIGRIIAAGVVLSSNDFAAAGSYDVDDGADTVLDVFQLGYRQRLGRTEAGAAEAGKAFPFLDLSVGRVTADQRLDLGGPVPDDSLFETRSLRALGGVRFPLRGRWFVQGMAGLEYSWVTSELTYRSPESAALAPVIDGVLVNWSAEALTLHGAGVLGYRLVRESGFAIDAGMEVVGLRTDPVEVDDPLQDVTTTSNYERLYAVFDVPTGISLWRRPLLLTPKIAHTFLSDELADPLDSNDLTEVGVTAAALMRASGVEFPVERIGLTVTYTRADAFEGWSFGLALARWSP